MLFKIPIFVRNKSSGNHRFGKGIFIPTYIYIYRDFLQRLFYCDIKNVTVKLRIYFSIYTKDCGAAEMSYSASVLGVSNFCSSPNW